jgi:ATP adenylyltransferase
MDILWAPWRHEYIVKSVPSLKKECVFCKIVKQKKDAKNFIFLRSSESFAVLNIYPFNGGHTMVIPYRHVNDLEKLTENERKDLLDLVIYVKFLMSKAFAPEAFNIGMNLGGHAGAGIPDHLHFHIVPRWKGDVNFMPALFGVKVIPVSLQKIYRMLRDAHKN